MKTDHGKFVSGRRYDGWNRPNPKYQKKRRPFLRTVTAILVVFIVIYGLVFLLPAFQPGASIGSTQESITSIIDSHPDYDIGVSLVDVKSDKQIDLGSQVVFNAGSTTKLLTATLTMREVEKNKLSLSQKINGYPISWHLQQLINQSNGDSWLALNHRFGQKKLENYAKEISLVSYRYKGNLISASDGARLASKLYSGKLINKSHTRTILKYMQYTNEESLIPAVADTQDVELYHKYGWLGSYIHDVAILETKTSAWVLAIYTHPKNDLNNATTSRDIIHSITRVTMRALTNNPSY